MSETSDLVDAQMSREDAAHEIDRLNAWRDTNEWLKLVGGMREAAPDSIGPELPPEVVALAMYAVRRLEGRPGSLTRSRVMAGTMPDADVVLDLARATDHELERTRTSRDNLRRAVREIADTIRQELAGGGRPSVLLILERLDMSASL